MAGRHHYQDQSNNESSENKYPVTRKLSYTRYSQPQFSDLKSMFDKKIGEEGGVSVTKTIVRPTAKGSASSTLGASRDLNDTPTKSRTFRNLEVKTLSGHGSGTYDNQRDLGCGRVSNTLPGNLLSTRPSHALRTASPPRKRPSSASLWTSKEQEAIDKAAETISRLIFHSERANEILLERRQSIEERKKITAADTRECVLKNNSLSQQKSKSSTLTRDSRKCVLRRDSYSPILQRERSTSHTSSSSDDFSSSSRLIGLKNDVLSTPAITQSQHSTMCTSHASGSVKLDLTKEDESIFQKSSLDPIGHPITCMSLSRSKYSEISVMPSMPSSQTQKLHTIKSLFEKSSDENDGFSREPSLKASPCLNIKSHPVSIATSRNESLSSKYVDGDLSYSKNREGIRKSSPKIIDSCKIPVVAHIPISKINVSDSKDRKGEPVSSGMSSFVASRIKLLERGGIDDSKVVVSNSVKKNNSKRSARIEKSTTRRRLSKKSSTSSDGYDDATSIAKNYHTFLLAERENLQPVSFDKSYKSLSDIKSNNNISRTVSVDTSYSDAISNIENFNESWKNADRIRSTSVSSEENIYDDIADVLAKCCNISDQDGEEYDDGNFDNDDGDDDELSGATLTGSFQQKRPTTPRKPSFLTSKGRRPSYKSRAASRKLSESIKRISKSSSSDLIHEGSTSDSATELGQPRIRRDTDDWETESEDTFSDPDRGEADEIEDADEGNEYLVPVDLIPLPTRKLKRKKTKNDLQPKDKNTKTSGERSNVIRKIQDKLKLLRRWKSTGPNSDLVLSGFVAHSDPATFYEVVDIPHNFEEGDTSVNEDSYIEEPSTPRFVVEDDVLSSRRQSKSSVVLSNVDASKASSLKFHNSAFRDGEKAQSLDSGSSLKQKSFGPEVQNAQQNVDSIRRNSEQQKISADTLKNLSPQKSESVITTPTSTVSSLVYERPPMSAITQEIRLFCDDIEESDEALNSSGGQGKTRSSSIPPPLPPRNHPVQMGRRSTIDFTESMQHDSHLLQKVPPPAIPKVTIVPSKTGSDSLSDDPFDEKMVNNEEITVIRRSRYQSHFEREPLYQYTSKELFSSATATSTDSDLDEEYDSDGPEYVPWQYPSAMISVPSHLDASRAESDKDSGLSTSPTPGPSTTSSSTNLFSASIPHRTLWCEMPEVIASGILKKIKNDEKKLQEAMFEIITSEASYYKSLNVLINTFAMSEELSAGFTQQSVLTTRDKHVLFSNIATIRDVSERFLADLEARWRENVLISDISDIIIKHATSDFEPYVRYCSNKSFQDRKYTELSKEADFTQAVRKLERTTSCQNLPMSSFFLLPMQRITRLPLLMDAVCCKMEVATPRHEMALRAIDLLNKVVKRCNDAAKRMERTEQLCVIDKSLDFKVKKIPLISASRFLVKRGELIRIVTDSSSILSFGRPRSTKQHIYLFLFNDLLLVTKKKSDGQYTVFDYCPRNSLHIKAIRDPANCSWLPGGAPSSCKNMFMLALLDNRDGQQVQMVLSANSPTDHARWMDAVIPKVEATSDGEKVYEEWDCPQVQATKEYLATQPDELSLENTDIVNVFRKMADGWYEGERIRDGERGWFPASCVTEINNYHVRARNLRQRYRLLVASDDYTTYASN